jgi:hypothetical protein
MPTDYQLKVAAKHTTQTICPNNPTGTARPWRAWLRTDYFSGCFEFATRDEAVAYLAYQTARLRIDTRARHSTAYERISFQATFLQETRPNGEVSSLADLELVPVYTVALPPAPRDAAKTTYQLTAEHMITKQGAAQALANARMFADADARRRAPDKFWSYVAVCIEQMQPEPEPAPATGKRITIHVVKAGKSWAWELRDASGKLETDSAHDGTYGVFATFGAAFDDAARCAKILLMMRIG